jgi:7,8-dihydropterin-6-yl-methyl-4-(beta-D-ribofuranosyl)aminobenzene 5'-phosphate synthase
MIITTLMDNTAVEGSGMVAEHGFSCLIELPNAMVLLDTGATGAFTHNARTLGKDLSKLDHIVISHSHYDHGGGLRTLMEEFHPRQTTLWTGHGFTNPKFSVNPTERVFRGVDFDAAYVRSQGLEWRTVTDDTTEIVKGVWIVTGFTRIHPLEKLNPRFLVEREGHDSVDDFSDEVMLVVESSKSLVLIVGCSHPGIVNMVDTVKARFKAPIYALLGGIHLVDASEERTDWVLKALANREIGTIGVSHCTGEVAGERLRKLISHYSVNAAGHVLELA